VDDNDFVFAQMVNTVVRSAIGVQRTILMLLLIIFEFLGLINEKNNSLNGF
jgi:hypothetical protein